MATPSGWARLGEALGGDSELAYQQGLNLGANTENALAQASERRTKAKAQTELAAQLKAAKVEDARSEAAVGALMSGGNLKDIGDLLADQQEYNFREDAANPDIPFATGNRRLMGVAGAPVERFASAGEGMVQDKFSNEEPTTTPIGDASIKAKEAQAGRAVAGAQPRVYIIGGIPYMVGGDGELQRKLTPEEVAANVGIITNERDRAKGAAKAESNLPAAFAKFRGATDNAATVMADVDKVLKDTSWASAGPAAWLSREVPGTPAFKMDKVIDSIKANAGFAELSKMRHESPTGGALGNVTEQELKFLQSAIASLDTAQNPEDLVRALTKVRNAYTRYKEYAEQDYDIAQQRSQYAPRTPAPATPGAAPPAASGDGAPVQIASDEEYDALPQGARYIAPDGKTRVKQ